MKVIFTESEVKEIILMHIRRTMGVPLDDVHFAAYMNDFCTVSISPEVKHDHHE